MTATLTPLVRTPVKHPHLCLADTLGTAAAFVLTNPQVPVVSVTATTGGTMILRVVVETADELDAAAAVFPGPWPTDRTKSHSERCEYFRFISREFDVHLTVIRDLLTVRGLA